MSNITTTLGAAVPPFTPHAISVSLPTWEDNVGYEQGDKRVVDVMVSGYPRFFIALNIQRLARICEKKFGLNGERCLLVPTRLIANQCRTFMVERSSKEGSPVPVRLVQFVICPEDNDLEGTCAELHVVLFPADAFPLAKQFWQHTGLGITSRLADRCLSMIPEASKPSSPSPSRAPPSKASNRHYSAKNSRTSLPPSPPEDSSTADTFGSDLKTYVEERYGRNLPLEAAAAGKRAMRRRIAGVLLRDSPSDWSIAGGRDAKLGPSTRGIKEVTEDDVFLYPTGMSTVWSAHQLALATRPLAKSVCFGFPYTDTLKILEKWGPGCHFFGNGTDEDLDKLERMLEEESQKDPSKPPILALFTEFPSNPLLRCADMSRLHKLADKYDFLIVVDETIGNFVNVEVLPYADVVVSSLSKVFSGDSNVMGGSLVLNPKGRHYLELKSHMINFYEDSYYAEDAIYMERNSRDFRRRIKVIDGNTEAVCDFLHSHSLMSTNTNPATLPPNSRFVIKEVFYPKYTTAEHFNRCRTEGGGYGGLFSLIFTTSIAAREFFNALPCNKGPSLGTNFTLACPYTILGHYAELDWAARYGVEESLVRVSVGMEDKHLLLQGFVKALHAAEQQ
ncbi:pyridoxal phosphate-dependent transferase [Abortiporus biennis]|nr:pyridoxal phosphate-dependent transferase [Abortiporus biennis]